MLSRIREIRRERYIRALVRNGLRLGDNVYLNDGFFLDPAHCHLITIENDVTFGPGVRVFAHDASSLKVVGKTKVAPVTIRAGAFVGAGTIILPGAEVGAGSIAGAGSIVSGKIPARELWAGNPARRLMSIEEYRSKLLALDGVEFDEASYASSVLSAERRDEMQRLLADGRIGFMVRKTST